MSGRPIPIPIVVVIVLTIASAAVILAGLTAAVMP